MFLLRKDRGSGPENDFRPSGTYICDECVELCAELIEEEFEQDEIERGPEEINLLKPKEIKAFLDDYVIGQDEAKKVLSVAGVQPL